MKIGIYLLLTIIYFGANIYWNTTKIDNESIKKDIVFISSFSNNHKISNKIIFKDDSTLYWFNINSFLLKSMEKERINYFYKNKNNSNSKSSFKLEELDTKNIFDSFQKIKKKGKVKENLEMTLNSYLLGKVGLYFYNDPNYSLLRIENKGLGVLEYSRGKYIFYPITKDGKYTNERYICNKYLRGCSKVKNSKAGRKYNTSKKGIEKIYFVKM